MGNCLPARMTAASGWLVALIQHHIAPVHLTHIKQQPQPHPTLAQLYLYMMIHPALQHKDTCGVRSLTVGSCLAARVTSASGLRILWPSSSTT